MQSIYESFLKPSVIKIKKITDTESEVILEPFERGFGYTLGNALRRVLLSSMPGAAPTEVDIEGVSHEYDVIEGVKEDVVNVLLNLKGVIFKLHDVEEVELTLDKKTSGEVLAKDIKLSNKVEIKNTTKLAITLSLGERPFNDLKEWKNAGADRYLLRFETSNKKLYNLIHPSDKKRNRFDILEELKSLDYEVGSGIMVGVPGQSFDDLANDICLFSSLQLDMIGVGPYIPHPETVLSKNKLEPDILQEQVPNSEIMTYKVLALSRITCPKVNIPSTTALSIINKKNGRELGLARGANIIMPNVTPEKYRKKYEIYPEKSSPHETAEEYHHLINKEILKIGRFIGTGPGHSITRSRSTSST